MGNRIFISGASGTGKTTIAKALAESLDIPFISSSAKGVWDDFNITSHRDVMRMKTRDKFNYQYRLIKKMNNDLKELPDFVTDRSPLCSMVHFMLQLGHIANKANTDKFFKHCDRVFQKGDILFIIRNDFREVENDGSRIINPYYQQLVDGVYISTITQRGVDLSGIISVGEIPGYFTKDQKILFIKESINK